MIENEDRALRFAEGGEEDMAAKKKAAKKKATKKKAKK